MVKENFFTGFIIGSLMMAVFLISLMIVKFTPTNKSLSNFYERLHAVENYCYKQITE